MSELFDKPLLDVDRTLGLSTNELENAQLETSRERRLFIKLRIRRYIACLTNSAYSFSSPLSQKESSSIASFQVFIAIIVLAAFPPFPAA